MSRWIRVAFAVVSILCITPLAVLYTKRLQATRAVTDLSGVVVHGSEWTMKVHGVEFPPGTTLGPEHAVAINLSPDISMLTLGGCAITDDFVDHLIELPSLNTLILEGSEIGIAAARKLVSKQTAITVLKLEGSTLPKIVQLELLLKTTSRRKGAGAAEKGSGANGTGISARFKE